jgi:two-component system, sensor histidine kinase and response regulator
MTAKPDTPAATDPMPAAPAKRAERLRHRLAGFRLLLVEDNPVNEKLARSLLEVAGAQVDSAENGLVAVERLRARPDAYDLVLMDVQTPVMDGYSATRLIRGELKLSLPILAMSAGVMASEQAQCAAAGMDDFIAKPIDIEQMFEALGRHLPPRPAAAPQAAQSAAQAAPLPAFEPEGLLALMQDNPIARDKVLALVEQMLADAPTQLTQTRAAWQAGQAAQAAQQLHRMRGSFGALGARRFAQATLELERVVRGDADTAGTAAAPLFDALAEILGQTAEQARAWLVLQRAAP